MAGMGVSVPGRAVRGRWPAWSGTALLRGDQSLVFRYVDQRYATRSLADGSIDYSTTASDLMTVQRAGPKWVHDEDGVLAEVPADTLAIQHDPATGRSQGALIEDSRTNLLLWSEDLTDAAWSALGVTVSLLPEPGPDGGDAWSVATDGTSTNNRLEQQVSVTPFSTYTASVFFRNVGGSERLRLQLRAFGVSPIKEETLDLIAAQFSSEWVRYDIAISLEDHDGLLVRVVRETAGAVTVEVANPQVEGNVTVSSYIPTTDSPATRAADTVTRPLGDEYDPGAGTYTIRAAVAAGETVATLGSVSVASTSGEMTTYTLSYSSDPGATALVLGDGRFEFIEYVPG